MDYEWSTKVIECWEFLKRYNNESGLINLVTFIIASVHSLGMLNISSACSDVLANRVLLGWIAGFDCDATIEGHCVLRVVHNTVIVIRQAVQIKAVFLKLVQHLWIYVLLNNSDLVVPIRAGLLVERPEGVEELMLDGTFSKTGPC